MSLCFRWPGGLETFKEIAKIVGGVEVFCQPHGMKLGKKNTWTRPASQ